MAYSIKPFGGPNYHKNAARAGQLTPCAICGKGVRANAATGEWPHTAIVINGGSSWGDASSPEDAGHMGAWPIGSDCHRRFRC